MIDPSAVLAAQQFVTIRGWIEFDARVMSGRNFLAAQTDRQSIERSKLQTTVTRDARDWRLALR